jgi:BirA family biotin operon repressor/biotin-[acetyl-CoA-carboxylase] ligase
VISVLDSVSSTQDAARDRLNADASTERLWVRARHQIAGRGRQGRRWESDPLPPRGHENLLISCAFRTRGETLPWPFISILAGAALHDCVAAHWRRPSAELALKWPNDLVWDAPGEGLRKLGGVLAELQHGILCVGWGLNLYTAPALPQARSWAQLDLEGLARLAPEAAEQLSQRLKQRFEELLDDWRHQPESASAALTRRLDEGPMACLKGRIGTLPESGWKARVLGLLPDGRLQVEALDGPECGRRLSLGSGEIAIDYAL